MALCIAQDMEASSYEYPETGGYVAGISYDFAKAFDVVPHDVMFRCLAKRGIDPRSTATTSGCLCPNATSLPPPRFMQLIVDVCP